MGKAQTIASAISVLTVIQCKAFHHSLRNAPHFLSPKKPLTLV